MEPTSSGRAQQRRPATRRPSPAVRLAHVVRAPSPPARDATDGSIVIEAGTVRVTVGRGADLTMALAVVAVLRGGSR